MRSRIIAIAWATAALLIVLQFLALRANLPAYEAFANGKGTLIVPADWWRYAGLFTPLACIALALWLHTKSEVRSRRYVGVVGLIALVPTSFIALLVASGYGPSSLDRVTLTSGKQLVLALEPVPTDSVYTLYQPTGPFGFWWRELDVDLTYSEDGRYTGDERLVLSTDDKWLAVARGGIWTDCFHMIKDAPIPCDVNGSPLWSDANYDRDMRLRSTAIQHLIGLRPKA